MKDKRTRKPGAIASEDVIPTKQKLAYAFGGFGMGMNGTMLNKLLVVFNIGFGLDPALIVSIKGIVRIVDACTDPIMGNISDNTRTRCGRRRPYILFGGIACSLVFPAIWFAPMSWGATAIGLYLLLSYLIFSLLNTVWNVPYYTLGMELTPDYNERTRLWGWTSFMSNFTALAGGWMITLITLPYFANPDTGEPDLVRGSRFLCIPVAIMMLFLSILPALFVKERYYKSARKQANIPMMESLKKTFSCKPFLYLAGIATCITAAQNAVGGLGLYANIYYTNQGDIMHGALIQSVKSSLSFGIGLGSIPVIIWFTQKYGKSRGLYVIMASAFIGEFLKIFCYTPDHPWLQIIPSLFNGFVSNALWMIVPSMWADIADYDELVTFKRREGSFSAIFSWILKSGITVGIMLSGPILNITGFDIGMGSDQPEEVRNNIMTAYIVVPVLFYSAALICLIKYPLSKARMLEIRGNLESRREKSNR